MNLHKIAKAYDTCPVFDAYSGVQLFKIQTSSFLESAVDGSTAARRTISTAPEITVPAHSCLLVLGELILLGRGNTDEWAGSAIRRSYWTKAVTDQFKILTPAEAVLSAAGRTAYGQKQYQKELSNPATESDLSVGWLVYLSASLSVPKDYFLRSGTTLYRVFAEYVDVDGYLTLQCEELDLGPVDVTFVTNSTYNPVTDSYGTASLTTKGVVVDFKKAYYFRSDSDPKAEPGDVALIVAKSAVTPVRQQQLNILSYLPGNWVIQNIKESHDSWALHIRKA